MKRRVTVDGEDCDLELKVENSAAAFVLRGAVGSTGTASVIEIAPGIFSVLLGNKSFSARVVRRGGELEITVGDSRYTIAVADPRDRSSEAKKQAASGPVEIRAQMPGKVVKLLVDKGASVEAGQSLLVVEAMKMQNEVKAQKHGVVGKVHVAEGATVVAGEKLILIE